MATKGKDKIIDGQIAFDFMGELKVEIKSRKTKEIEKNIIKQKEIKTKKVFRENHVNVKPNHLKKNRKVRKVNGK